MTPGVVASQVYTLNKMIGGYRMTEPLLNFIMYGWMSDYQQVIVSSTPLSERYTGWTSQNQKSNTTQPGWGREKKQFGSLGKNVLRWSEISHNLKGWQGCVQQPGGPTTIATKDIIRFIGGTHVFEHFQSYDATPHV